MTTRSRKTTNTSTNPKDAVKAPVEAKVENNKQGNTQVSKPRKKKPSKPVEPSKESVIELLQEEIKVLKSDADFYKEHIELVRKTNTALLDENYALMTQSWWSITKERFAIWRSY